MKFLRRPRRRFRFLIGLLFTLSLLLLLVFPLLFLHVESGQSLLEVEEAAGAGDDALYASFASALYWSIVTPVSLDFDGWPQTSAGKFLVRTSDVTKLLALLVLVRLFSYSSNTRLIGLLSHSTGVNDEEVIGGVVRQAKTQNGAVSGLSDKQRKRLARTIFIKMRKDDSTSQNGHR